MERKTAEEAKDGCLKGEGRAAVTDLVVRRALRGGGRFMSLSVMERGWGPADGDFEFAGLDSSAAGGGSAVREPPLRFFVQSPCVVGVCISC